MRSLLSSPLQQYAVVTTNYWAFTLTDGALRMLVVLYFYQLGYAPLQIALLFVFYEAFGVVTNLAGGWLGARLGLNRTMQSGLALQLLALSMLCVPESYLSVIWVMAAQALSGIAKDLNKMSAKSAIKVLIPNQARGSLLRWVSLLTGSKNSLKGLGFFLGALLLSLFDFRTSILIMLASLAIVFLMSTILLREDLGKSRGKPKIRSLFAKSASVNRLSLARLFLFAARDVWFVIGLPVYLGSVYHWTHWQVGAFMASWIIVYGLLQTQAPKILGKRNDGGTALLWAAILCLTMLILSLISTLSLVPLGLLVAGLLIFAMVFAVNSSLHSFLIVDYAAQDSVAMDVGFYYMANAVGRLLGTVLSGWLYQAYGLSACLYASTALIMVCLVASLRLPRISNTLTE